MTTIIDSSSKRNIGVDIIANVNVTEEHKEKVKKLAESLSPKLFFQKKTDVKFVGRLPTNRIRIALHISREADPDAAINTLTAILKSFLEKEDWIQKIEINRIALVVESITELTRTKLMSDSTILDLIRKLTDELEQYIKEGVKTTEEITKANQTKEEILNLVESLSI